jgi:hypothetical protein
MGSGEDGVGPWGRAHHALGGTLPTIAQVGVARVDGDRAWSTMGAWGRR